MGPGTELALEIELWGHVLVANPTTRAELDQLLREARNSARGIELLVVQAQPELLDSELVAECTEQGIGMLAFADAPIDVVRASRFGIPVFGQAELRERLPQLLNERMHGGSVTSDGLVSASDQLESPPLGRIVAVWGAPGAPGASTVAANLAVELHRILAEHAGQGSVRRRPRVCVVDADTWSPAIAPMWGVVADTPGLAAAGRLAELGSLSEDEFLRLALPGPDGVLVLSGLTALDRWPELSASRVAAVMGALRNWCELAVVDLGSRLDLDAERFSDPLAPRRSTAARVALEHADLSLGVGAADPVSLARLVRAWPEWAAIARDSQLIVNRLRISALGLQPERQVRQLCEQFLQLEPLAVLPDDPHAADTAVLRGMPLAQLGRSALRRGILQLAGAVHERVHTSSAPANLR